MAAPGVTRVGRLEGEQRTGVRTAASSAASTPPTTAPDAPLPGADSRNKLHTEKRHF